MACSESLESWAKPWIGKDFYGTDEVGRFSPRCGSLGTVEFVGWPGEAFLCISALLAQREEGQAPRGRLLMDEMRPRKRLRAPLACFCLGGGCGSTAMFCVSRLLQAACEPSPDAERNQMACQLEGRAGELEKAGYSLIPGPTSSSESRRTNKKILPSEEIMDLQCRHLKLNPSSVLTLGQGDEPPL